MADKSYEIEVKTTSDTTGVTSVQDALRETKEEAEGVGSTIAESMDEVSNASQEASDSISETAESTEQLNDALSSTDASPFEEVSNASQEASDSTEQASANTELLAVALTSIDPSIIQQLADAMEQYSTTSEDGADATEDLMEGLVSLTMAEGLGNMFMGLANKAGDYNDSMLRMGLALEGHAMTVEQVSSTYGASVSKMAEETGRGGGSVRNHFTNMAIAGVKSSQILESSFQAVANGSFYSGESIESLSNKFQRITMTGMLSAKQLSSLGLTMEDLAKVMGVSADEVSAKFKEMSAEERASVMSTASAQKYGTEVNDVFKNSWEGLWTQLDKGQAGLERLVGELLLPYLIPAVKNGIEIVDGLTQAFKSLPQPAKDVMGGFMLVATSISTLGLGLNAVIRLGGMILSPFRSIAKLFGVDLDKEVKKLATSLKTHLVDGFNTAKTKASGLASSLKTTLLNSFRSVSNFFKTQFIPALRNVGTSFINLGKQALLAGANALKSAGMWIIQKAQVLASAIANGVATASQWALNIAMSMNPIGLLIIAIVGLIAILGYLYFNNEQVRGAIDGLGQALMGIATIIWDSLVSAWETLTSALQGFWDYIVGLGESITSTVGLTSSNVINGIIGFLAFWFTLPIQIGVTFVNILAQALGFGNNFVQRIVSAGSRAVSNFISYISQIPAKLGAELGNALNKVNEWASTLPAKFWEAGVNAVKNFLNALGINSPGTMQRMIVWEVSEMGRRIPLESRQLLSNVSEMGKNVVDAFGDPSLQIGTNLQNLEVGNGSLNSQNQNNTSTVNLTLNVGSVDRQERVDEILTTIRDYFEWDNKTAGRTI